MAVSRLSNQSIQQAFPKGVTVWDGVSNTGAMDAISFIVVPSGGIQNNLEFNNIPQTYTHLQIRAYMFGDSGGQMNLRLNNDTGSNYTSHYMYGTNASAISGGTSSASTAINSGGINLYGGLFATNPRVLVLDILDYTSTVKNKTVRLLTGVENNGNGEVAIQGGCWLNSSAAVTTVNFNYPAGKIAQYSHFALYGIK